MRIEKLSSTLALLLLGCGASQVAPKASPSSAPAAAPPTDPETEGEASEGPQQTPIEPAPARSEATPQGRSCDGRAGAGNDCAGISCCARAVVPAGTFDMRTDQGKTLVGVRVARFSLDRFEATVGRFKTWAAAGRPTPREGQVIYDDGHGGVVRWSHWAAVQDEAKLKGWARYDTWSAGDDRRPKNFVNWYTAAAFCHWEGGRLPTEAEFKYVAAGGDEQRAYPWGSDAPTTDHAVFNCMGDGNASCSLADILPVGSRPKGQGRWGHFDVAGSMFEWTLDAHAVKDEVEVARGGGFCYIGGVDRRAKTELRPDVTRRDSPGTSSHMTGVRCAYDE